MKYFASILMTLCLLTSLDVGATESNKANAKPVISQKKLAQSPLPIPENMKIKRGSDNKLVIPQWCQAWFDGCNDCKLATRNGQMIAGCTSRICDDKSLGEAYCTKRKDETKQ